MYTILRSFHTSNTKTYTSLYKTYVRPIIEYNCSIWNPNLTSNIRKIESIQTKFTKTLCQKLNIKYQNYAHRLEMLNLETLEVRRLKTDLILLFKIHNNLLDIKFDEFFTKNLITTNYNLRRHTNYLKTPNITKTNTRQNFFSNRIVRVWNKLPQEIISTQSLPNFKYKLDKLNLAEYTNLIF